jgi:hypothetical protein
VARLAIIAAALFWVIGTAIGVAKVHEFESTPGYSTPAPERWPADSSVKRISNKATLLMFVHAECSCTHASLSELNQLMSQSAGQVAAWVLFVSPGDADDKRVIHTIAGLTPAPGIQITKDINGAELTRFGALTSGDVVIYSAEGKLLFSGGITGSRGHEGDNMGRRLISQALAHEPTHPSSHPVFGCSLGAADR